MMNILEIDGLTKHYGAIKAVDQLNLQVGKGQIYGILGPNGSGKTTTLGMIMGIIPSVVFTARKMAARPGSAFYLPIPPQV